MKLKKKQREALLKWVAEGVQSDEINKRAAVFDPPFSVSRQLVDHYRKTRAVSIALLREQGEAAALSEGLAARAERVIRLKVLAEQIEEDLFGDRLWVDDVKGVGSGDAAEVVDFEYFNKAEVDAYRGILDDIAVEVGERIKNFDVKSAGKALPSAVISVYIPDNGREKSDDKQS